MPTIGWSDFARKQHSPGNGNTYTNLSDEEVIKSILDAWEYRKPGQGETGIDRKVVVPITFSTGTFFLPTVKLVDGLPVHAEAKRRQEGEDLYIETFVYEDDVKRLGLDMNEPNYINVVCYSADALMENGGNRSTSCDWEIVALLASMQRIEPMTPLAMARNFLGKPGGTLSVYSAQEFAEAIYFHATNRGVRVKKRT